MHGNFRNISLNTTISAVTSFTRETFAKKADIPVLSKNLRWTIFRCCLTKALEPFSDHQPSGKCSSMGGLHCRHVGVQNKRTFLHIVCIKMQALNPQGARPLWVIGRRRPTFLRIYSVHFQTEVFLRVRRHFSVDDVT